ncbi:hypothetical protein CDG77_23995 [Nostoc sp. 'Peltigera membranacea cyanobiont' 213]|nr:hypothetical protein CDG77_23995 [Nostoc sp. 'Peltigera membranacea cyanobiont' 213]
MGLLQHYFGGYSVPTKLIQHYQLPPPPLGRFLLVSTNLWTEGMGEVRKMMGMGEKVERWRQ